MMTGNGRHLDASKAVLGKAVAIVGRDRELAELESLLAECVGEPILRIAIVTASPGFGKSRLLGEFLSRLAEARPNLSVWIGRGDPMRAKSPLAMAASLMRNTAGILEGDPPEACMNKLIERVASKVAEGERERVTAFLAAMIGVSLPGDENILVRAARSDASLMSDQVQRAWEDFIDAECRQNALLLVFEDLHWIDPASAKLMDSTLRKFRERALMVLGAARPEVDEVAPRLWLNRGAQEIRLGGLTRKAAESLVRQVLGDEASERIVAGLIERAGGNAFHLEELIREAVAGRSRELPASVQEIVEARLASLDEHRRRALGAASVFGQVFWSGGVDALIGSNSSDESLGALVEQEMVSRQPHSQFPGQKAGIFRHALVQEGTYAKLSSEERITWHRRAGDWLERMGETDAYLLAVHFERGEQAERALKWFPRAAQQALEANDLAGAVERVARGVACGAQGTRLGELRLIEAEARNWLGENVKSEGLAIEAMRLLPPGSSLWFAAAREAMITALKSGNVDGVIGTASAVKQAKPAVDALDACRTAKAWAAMNLLLGGHYALVSEMMEDLPASVVLGDLRTEALVMRVRANWAAIEGRWESLGYMESALAGFLKAGDLRSAVPTRADLAFLMMGYGAWRSAETLLLQALADAERFGLRTIIPQIKHNIGYAMMGVGTDLAAAAKMEEEAAAEARLEGVPRWEGIARTYLALIHLRSGELEKCEAQASNASELLRVSPGSRAMALAVLALGRVRSRKTTAALEASRDGMELMRALGNVEEGESLIRLAYAEALHASGETSRAKMAIAEARVSLLNRADRVGDPSRRETFLTRVVENARTLSLAAEWLGA